ncbi:ATP-binding protein [Dactylosporangium sp. NPDC051541]|uniref:ATP-binding protein n=1 Tax=Dactylosporangium sp. NPDC051541 TaxID=3363977 RepID=UPI0037ACBB6C
MRLSMTVALPRRTSSVGEARHILDVLLSLTTASEATRDYLAILLTEACANVVHHGDAGTSIDLRITIEAGTCVLEVGNHGRRPDGGDPFTHLAPPDQPHGRGLPLIAALADTAEFLDTTPGYVLLRIARRLHDPGGEGAADLSGP